MRIVGSSFFIALLCLSTGCATVRGDKQKVRFETDPSGANLLVDGSQKYTTPVDVPLKRKDAHTIAVSKPGYRPIEFTLEAQWDGASMTDLAVPGGSALVGLSVVSGSDKSFNTLAKITLEKSNETAPAKLYQHRGKLYNKDDYDKAIKSEESPERFMGGTN